MTKTQISLAAAFALIAHLAPAPVAAQTSARFPVRAVERGLTLRGGVMELRALGTYRHTRVVVDGLSEEPIQGIGLTPTLAYGLWDDFTISADIFPVTFWPEDQLGNPALSARYRFVIDQSVIALGARVHIPFADASRWQIDAEVPVQIYLARDWRIQTGAEVTLYVEGEVLGRMAVPLELQWQVTRDTHLQLATGAVATELSAESVRVPVELSTAYTFASALGPVLELSLRARFPELFAPGAAADPVRLGTFEAGVGLSAFFYQ